MEQDYIKNLIFHAHNQDSDIRINAIVQLRDYTNIPEVAHTLRSLIYDVNGNVRILAAEALSKARLFPEDAIPVLITTLEVIDDPHISKVAHSKEWRRVAAGSLRFYGSKAVMAIPALKNALLDPDENVRMYAAISLGEIGKESIVVLQDLRAARQSETNLELRKIIDDVIKKIVGSEHFIVITEDKINNEPKDFRQDRFGRF